MLIGTDFKSFNNNYTSAIKPSDLVKTVAYKMRLIFNLQISKEGLA